MPTTDTRLAAVLLDSLTAIGIPFAILHREADIARGAPISDVDVAIAKEPVHFLSSFAATVAREGLYLILTWPYDRNSLTTFWTNSDASDGVQLDLLFDPGGRASYSLRTGVAIDGATRGDRWPTLHSRDAALYLLVKRWRKGDMPAVEELVAQLRRNSGIQRRSDEILGRVGCQIVRRALKGGRPKNWERPLAIVRSRLSRRGITRVVRPVGVCVRIKGDPEVVRAAAESAVSRLRRVLLDVQWVESIRPLARTRLYVRRLRPVVLLTGCPCARTNVSVEIKNGDPGIWGRQLVDALSEAVAFQTREA